MTPFKEFRLWPIWYILEPSSRHRYIWEPPWALGIYKTKKWTLWSKRLQQGCRKTLKYRPGWFHLTIRYRNLRSEMAGFFNNYCSIPVLARFDTVYTFLLLWEPFFVQTHILENQNGSSLQRLQALRRTQEVCLFTGQRKNAGALEPVRYSNFPT